MKNLTLLLIGLAGMIFGYVSLFFNGQLADSLLLTAGSGLTMAFALGAVSTVTDGVLANIKRWHGSIDEQFAAIDNLVSTITAHQPAWSIPTDLLAELTGKRDQLQTLINRCRSNAGSKADRELRSALLKSTVGFCLLQVRIWAYGEYAAGVLTAGDVHTLGFLLPGETGGRHARTDATDITAEVKVSVVNEDFIRVVIDQSAGENAARVEHGWPAGVRTALIVILTADGKTEVYHHLTTRLHNDIHMPEGSRGKLFIIKAAFLKHVDDEPRFGKEPTFSMPLNTEDLAATLDRQHHEEFEAHVRETELHRQEVEQVHTEPDAQKK